MITYIYIFLHNQNTASATTFADRLSSDNVYSMSERLFIWFWYCSDFLQVPLAFLSMPSKLIEIAPFQHLTVALFHVLRICSLGRACLAALVGFTLQPAGELTQGLQQVGIKLAEIISNTMWKLVELTHCYSFESEKVRHFLALCFPCFPFKWLSQDLCEILSRSQLQSMARPRFVPLGPEAWHGKNRGQGAKRRGTLWQWCHSLICQRYSKILCYMRIWLW